MKKTLYSFLFCTCTLLGDSFFNEVNSIINNHPDIQKQLEYYQSVEQDIAISKSEYQPSLDFQSSFGKEKIEYEGTTQDTDETFYQNSLTLTQNLFQGFATDAKVEQNRARLSSAAFTLLDSANNLALESIKSYMDVLREDALTNLYQENVKNHEDIYSKIKERTDAGRGRMSEVQQTLSRLHLAKSNLIVQQNNFFDTLSNYHYYVGKHFDMVNTQKPIFDFSLPKDVDEASIVAIKNNPAIKVMRSNVLAKKAEYTSATSNFYPSIDAVVSRDWEHNANGVNGDKDTTKAYLSLKYNLYKGGSHEAQRVKVMKQIEEENSALNKLKREVIKATRLAFSSYKSYEEQIKYLALHVQAAKETLDSYNEEYNLGRRDLLAILDAQKEYITARQTLLRAEYDFLYAKFRLLNVTSQLPKVLNLDVLKNVDYGIIKESLEDDKHFDIDSLCDNDTNPSKCLNTPVLNIGYLPAN
ncbi:MAG TPA: hypothetical protein CFH82_09735 [Sulfurospirillum sp. UBA12182]|jgi:adhesin transport system outer membrane protein|nr:MAG TPA: hypothetical protein CFH82_09735 [Sulfurospirillum sp. UBA12182]